MRIIKNKDKNDIDKIIANMLNIENGYSIYNDDLSYTLVTGSLDYIRSPESWTEVQERIDYWNVRKNF